jgi:hypothetical protein
MSAKSNIDLFLLYNAILTCTIFKQGQRKAWRIPLQGQGHGQIFTA